MTPAAFDKWLKQQTAAVASPNPAVSGAAVFKNNGCGACHTLTAAGATGKVGPDLDKLPAYAAQAKQPLASFVRGVDHRPERVHPARLSEERDAADLRLGAVEAAARRARPVSDQLEQEGMSDEHVTAATNTTRTPPRPRRHGRRRLPARCRAGSAPPGCSASSARSASGSSSCSAGGADWHPILDKPIAVLVVAARLPRRSASSPASAASTTGRTTPSASRRARGPLGPRRPQRGRTTSASTPTTR